MGFCARRHANDILSTSMQIAVSTVAWIGFCIFILLMLAIDLGVFNRKPHEVSYKDAAIWSAVWVTLALIFAALLFGPLGWELFGDARHAKALEFLTGYLIELSLSVDNLFVFVLIFSYFKVPPKYQHRVLFWGVMGALVMRVHHAPEQHAMLILWRDFEVRKDQDENEQVID